MSQKQNMSADFIRSLWPHAFILKTWSGSVVLDVAGLNPPVRGLSASLHPEAGCAAPTGPGCTDPLWTERSRTEPNRTEPNLAEPLRGARPSRAHWVRAGDSVISRDSAAVCPSGWRLQAAGGWGSARCWFWCCAVPLLRDTPRGWVNTPGHTHTLTHARTHTHTRTGDPVMGQMLLLMHEWWAYRLLLWKSSKNVSNLFLIFNKSSEWRQTPSQYTRLY